MPFKKGDPNINTGGRKKGSKNKTTNEMKDILNHALFGDAQSIADDLAKLEPKDRLMLKAKFAPFVLPTLKAVDMNVDMDVKSGGVPFSINYDEDLSTEEGTDKKEDKEEDNG